MLGQFGQVRLEGARMELLQRFGTPAVETLPADRRQSVVHSFPDERMGEPKTVPEPGHFDNEVRVDQLADNVIRRVAL